MISNIFSLCFFVKLYSIQNTKASRKVWPWSNKFDDNESIFKILICWNHSQIFEHIFEIIWRNEGIRFFPSDRIEFFGFFEINIGWCWKLCLVCAVLCKIQFYENPFYKGNARLYSTKTKNDCKHIYMIHLKFSSANFLGQSRFRGSLFNTTTNFYKSGLVGKVITKAFRIGIRHANVSPLQDTVRWKVWPLAQQPNFL